MTGPIFDGLYEYFRRSLLAGTDADMSADRPVRSDTEARRFADGADGVLPLREATRTWFAISLQTFGGPAGQIAVMQRTLVDEKRWIGQGGSCTR